MELTSYSDKAVRLVHLADIVYFICEEVNICSGKRNTSFESFLHTVQKHNEDACATTAQAQVLQKASQVTCHALEHECAGMKM